MSNLNADLKSQNEELTIFLKNVVSTSSSSDSSKTVDYEDLKNKPSINEITLTGDKSFEDLGLEELTNLEIEDLIDSQA